MQTSADIVKENYKPGDYIFFEGDLDYHFYIVHVGKVQIFTKTKSGKRVDIATIEEGESFGEFALLDRQPRSASAQALTECTLVRVSEAGYHKLMDELPGWASSMMRSFSMRLKNMNHLLKELPQFVKSSKAQQTDDPSSASGL